MRLPLFARWGTAARGLGVTAAVVSITAFVGLWIHGCQNDRRLFECGAPLDGNSSVTRACDGPNEVCICWTHACARRQSPDHVKGEAHYCESGFRYLDPPFGPPKTPKPIDVSGGETTSSTTDTGSTTSTSATLEPIPIDADLGECVPVALVEWSVTGTQLCKDSEHAPDTYPDAGAEDASTGGAGGGGTTSSGGGETSGTTTGGSGGVTTSSSGGTGGMTTSGGGTGGATGGTGGAT